MVDAHYRASCRGIRNVHGLVKVISSRVLEEMLPG